MPTKNKFSQTFFLSAGEVNAEREMSLSLLTSKLIDIATAHANSLGIGNPSMESLGCGWVLSRIAVEMMRYPRVNETYTLSTWIESINRHFSVRNFQVSDAEGNPMGYAQSIWMILNMETRENYGLSHITVAPENVAGETIPIARPGKHRVIVPMDAAEVPAGAAKATEPAGEYTFRYGDLDFYRHVNTVRYITLLLNSFTLEQMDRTQISRLELAFMREGRYDERVRILRSDEEPQTLFSLTDADDGTPLVFASVSRRPRNFS